MQWKIERHLILWGFVAALAILAFAGWESHRDTVRVAEAARAQKHSYEVQRMIDETAARLVDAETGQRGYLLTGNEAYLEPYRGAMKSLDRTMGQLKDLTSDNPNQRRRMQALEPLVEKKLAELQTTINLRKSKGLAAANEVVLAGSGKQWMGQIRGVLAEMANEESDLRNIRTQEMTEALATANRTVVGGSLASILLLSLVFTILLRELSERRRAQEALAKREKWFSTTLGSIGDAVIATDMNGAVTFMNSVAQSLTGWSLEDAQDKAMDLVFDIVNKETRRPVENPVKKVFREGKVVGLADHSLLISKNGREFDIEDSAAPIVTGEGEEIGVVLVFRDLTQRKQAGEELRQSEEKFRLLVHAMKDYAIFMVDPAGRILNWTAAAERIKGYRAEEVIGQHFSIFYLPEDVEQNKPFEELKVAEEQGQFEEEGWRRRKDGSRFWAHVLITAIRDEKGELRGFGKVTRDISERRKAEEAVEQRRNELLRSNIALVAVNKELESFSYSVSHDLRAPLRAIDGFSHALLEDCADKLEDVDKSYLNRIRAATQRMGLLIDDLLNLARISRTEMHIQSLDLSAMVRSITTDLHKAEPERRVEFGIEDGLKAMADPGLMQIVLVNLLSNAWKFTSKRPSAVIAFGKEALNGTPAYFVRDDGAGFDPAYANRLFGAFQRLHAMSEFPGTGIGLATAQRIIHRHGGRIWAESAVGHGATFYLTLAETPS